jgi:subtilisin family serine protease
MYRLRQLCLIFFLLLTSSGMAQLNSARQKTLENQKKRLQEEIKQINTLLFKNTKKEKSLLSQVEDLNIKISVRNDLVKVNNQQANLLTQQININQRNITDLRKELEVLKKDYAEMIQKDGVQDSLPLIEKNLVNNIYHYEKEVKQANQLGWNARTTGDDPDNFSQRFYGDGNVMPKSDDELHGTHVAGIIAATRNNDIGMDGIASTAEIMCLRAVPNEGDEYDKDVALSIRYAVDNGAQIINMSFGKEFSPHSDKVREAIVYAASKGVLLVNAAGNDSVDIDSDYSYPSDRLNNEPEVSSNFITIGAIGPVNNPLMVAPFSNYGNENVDLFAPGAIIYAPVPSDKYEALSGTSMAAPAVSGVAAILLSYYPKLSPEAIRKALMASVVKIDYELQVGYNRRKSTMGELSQTGGIVNAYNALLYVSDQQKNLRKL